MKIIIVTGSGGLLAGALISSIANTDPDCVIYALSSHKDQTEKRFASLQQVRCVSNEEFLNGAIELPAESDSVAVHCAFARSNHTDDLLGALSFTRRFLTYIKKLNVKRAIHISSQSVYRRVLLGHMLDEDAPIEPCDYYGLAKAAAEEILCAALDDTGREYANVRLASISHNARINYLLAKRIQCGEHVDIISDQGISFIHVGDAVAAICLLIYAKELRYRHYNVGAEIQVTPLQLARKLSDLSQTLYQTPAADISIHIEQSSLSVLMSAKRMKDEFAWTPNYSLEDILLETLRTERGRLKNEQKI